MATPLEQLRRLGHFGLGLLPVPLMLALRFVYKFGRWPDFNHPRTFNEKINWRKLHQRDPRMVVYADKIAVKEVVAQVIGEAAMIPTLWVGESAERYLLSN